MAFYGDEPTAEPDDVQGTLQIPFSDPTFEQFDVVDVQSDGSITRVLAHAKFGSRSRATDLRLVDVPGTDTLSERLALVSIIPRITIPAAKIGHKIFLTVDPETEPTELPDTGVFNRHYNSLMLKCGIDPRSEI